MKVKVGDKVYDGECEPIMVILTDVDKENIRGMIDEAHMYAHFPEEWDDEDGMRAWMHDGTEEP